MAGQNALSQTTEIEGVVNKYGRVKKIFNTVNTNPDSVVVEGASAIWDGTSPFEIALFVQMKGMLIDDPTNYPTEEDWGKDQSIYNTGIYSFMLVDRVVQDSIVIFSSSLRELVGPVSIPQTAQLIRVPYYESARLSGDLQAAAWNPGTGTGGVLSVFASDKLDLSVHKIDVSGQGFRGGDTLRNDSDPLLCPDDDKTFYLDTAEHLAGRKGESLVYEGYGFTRGNRYNYGGGGGGQGRNAGGGGGANSGIGGFGGRERDGLCTPYMPFGSYGGYSAGIHFGNDENRLFMGSGGGSSMPYSGLTATPGGNGGGIVIIITDTLAADPVGDTSSIFASGQSVRDTSFTGGGGGGAGGFIVLDIDYVEGAVKLDVSGGKGGDTYDPVHRHGPGGGGGGGVIWHSGPVLLNGLKGKTSSGAEGRHYPQNVIVGTSPAEGGEIIPDLVVPLRGFFFNFISGDQEVCQDSIPTEILGSKPKGDTAFHYVWQDSTSGTAWQDIPGASGDNPGLYRNYSPDTLTVTTWYRRIVTQKSDPFESDTSGLVEKTVYNRIRNNLVAPHDTICYDLKPAPMYHSGGPLTGGKNGIYNYQWLASRDGGANWTEAGPYADDGLDTQEGFIPGRLQDTTLFRRQVSSQGICTHLSDPLAITVLPELTGNDVTGDDHVCQFEEPADSIRGPRPGGGDYLTAYEYAWEGSGNMVNWKSISDQRNYFPGIMDSVTTFYRRLVYSGKNATCKDTSNIITVLVDAIIQQNSIAPDTAVCAETPTNYIYPDAGIIGGNGTYLYRFERSTDLAGWAVARDWNPDGRYDPMELAGTTWFRRIVESGECADTSNSITFSVDTVILNNLIARDDTICAGTASDIVSGSTADGGDWTAYTYVWDRSTDRTGWENGFYSGRDLPPQILYDSTWYRRRVLSGVCSDTSALVVVNVHDTITGNLIWPDSTLAREACVDLPKILRGQDGNNGLAGGTGRAADFIYLWEKQDLQSGLWSDAPAGGYLSNDRNDYQTEVLTGPGYSFRRFVRSGKCYHTSAALSLDVKSRPVAVITSDPTPTDACFTGTDIGIVVSLRFDDGLKPYTLYYNDGQGGTGMVEDMDFYEGEFTVPRGSADSNWYVIRIDSIIDENGCRAVMPQGGQGSRQMVVYRDQPPSLVQDTFRVCGEAADVSVVGGLGSIRYWGPDDADYAIVPKDNPSATFTLNTWKNDTVSYPVTWSQKNGICPLNSVGATVTLYRTPLPARVDPELMEVYFRQTMPMWADSVAIGLGTWKGWDWEVDNRAPLTDVHNNQAMVNLGGTEDMRAPVTRQLTWMVQNGVCPEDEVLVTIKRYDLQLFSAFSPNGDLFNEYLILDGLEYADRFTLRIFSRHGRLVKTVTEADKMSNPFSGEENVVWDGRMEDGSEAEDGTYFYMIEVVHAGQKYNYKNYLELIRSDPNR